MGYLALRDGVSLLAAPAEAQVAWLDDIFRDMTNGGSAEGFGNYELLANYCEDMVAIGHQVSVGQVAPTEEKAFRRLDEFIGSVPKDDEAIWLRESLFADQRWEEISRVALEVLATLPDKANDPEWVKRYGGGYKSRAIPAG